LDDLLDSLTLTAESVVNGVSAWLFLIMKHGRKRSCLRKEAR
jgi:hypothetical protein